MNIQIGNFSLITIGHQTKMGDVAQVIEMGNNLRIEKNLTPIPLDEILRRPYFWEFVISRDTQKNSNSNSGDSPELKNHFKSDYSDLLNY